MGSQFKSILIRLPNWVGDLVMATPILTDVRQAFPRAKITVMCLHHLAPLIEKDPTIDELFHFVKPKGFVRRDGERELINTIRCAEYDLGILLTHSFSSAWLFWQGQVKERVGYRTDGRGLFLTKGLPRKEWGHPIHQVDAYKHILQRIGIPPSSTYPRLFLDSEEIERAWAIVKRFDIDSHHTLIGINPGAAYGSSKCWLPDRFRSVAQQLCERNERVRILFFGDLSQKELICHICQGLSSQVVNLSGMTTLRELMALIKICSVLLTNDSGPMHIGASLGVPICALFGSTDPKKTAPMISQAKVVYKEVPCSPCFLRECPIHFPCMKEIGVDEVVEGVFSQLYHSNEVKC